MNKLIYIFTLLPIIINSISLFYLPDKIPAHFSFNDEVTRYGSKYEALIIPFLIIIFALSMLYYDKSSKKDNKNSKIIPLSSFILLLIFNAVNFYFLYTSFNNIVSLNNNSLDIYKIVFSILGLFLLIFGNFMPKFKKNNIIGIRTTYSLKNDENWYKSQKFAGIIFVITGIIMLICNMVFFERIACLIFSSILFIICIGIIIIFSKIKNKDE